MGCGALEFAANGFRSRILESRRQFAWKVKAPLQHHSVWNKLFLHWPALIVFSLEERRLGAGKSDTFKSDDRDLHASSTIKAGAAVASVEVVFGRVPACVTSKIRLKLAGQLNMAKNGNLKERLTMSLTKENKARSSRVTGFTIPKRVQGSSDAILSERTYYLTKAFQTHEKISFPARLLRSRQTAADASITEKVYNVEHSEKFTADWESAKLARY